MGILKQLKRSKEKSKLMRELINSLDFQSSNYSKYKDRVNENYDKFYDYICTDYILGPVIKSHNVDKNQIFEYMNRLVALGYGWVKNQYVPVCAFSFAESLNYVLTAIEQDTNIAEVGYNLKQMM